MTNQPLVFDTVDDSDCFLQDELQLIQFEADQNNDNRSWGNLLWSIFNYIISNLLKNQRSFNIGVFTVFLTVSFLCATKSIFDVVPITFIHVSQENLGVFDFVLTSDKRETSVNGDVNHYAGDPFTYEKEKED